MLLYYFIRLIIRVITRTSRSNRYRVTRKMLEWATARFIIVPGECTITSADAAGVPAEWVSWQGADEGGIILYLHGGGYVLFSPRTHRDLISRISRECKARALSIEYRLAPEYPCPAAADDAVTAYRWLLDGGADPARIAVMGDSAGGGLALAFLQIIRDMNIPLPACAVCLSPWADLTCSGDSFRKNRFIDPVLPAPQVPEYARMYAPDEHERARPPASPLFGDLSNLPPILVHVGTDEILLDDSRRLASRASATNTIIELKIWPRMVHVFQALAFTLPQARESIKEIGEFVARHIP